MQITMVVVVAGGAPSHTELAMPTVNLHKWPTAHNMGNMPLCHICPGLLGGIEGEGKAVWLLIG